MFLNSLDRCRASEHFVTDFYDRLLATDDEIRARFRFTDMVAQRKKLADSLELCAGVVGGDHEALARLTELGQSHDQHHLNIKPEWYPHWLEAIVETASEHDPDWDAACEDSWRVVLGYIVNRLASFYDR